MGAEELIFEKSPYVEAAKAVEQGNVATLEKLIKQGIDVNYEGRETKTPWGKDTVTLLLWATLSESAKGAEALLKAGADPNKATRGGMVPLMIASALKSDDLFELLLIRYNADPNKVLQIRPRKTPLMILLQERKNLGEKRFERAETLIKHGADVNLDVDRGKTAFVDFAIQEDWRGVYWLLDHAANYEARNSIGATMMCFLRDSYSVNSLAPSEAFTYRDKVRDWLLAHGVARSRLDPSLHPSAKCDD
ncbi:ankyrin repeat domain-containing protein [Uliginosibacterium sp. sgz301328]|uniref:ankyrin repeat domain-containing protein n=1 Tax=Uliginosibacterium sp. sgz301328 TaxID=3243764 RepID=UPI00359D0CE4